MMDEIKHWLFLLIVILTMLGSFLIMDGIMAPKDVCASRVGNRTRLESFFPAFEFGCWLSARP